MDESIDFMGVDTLSNYGDSEIAHIVTHKESHQSFTSVVVTNSKLLELSIAVGSFFGAEVEIKNKLTLKLALGLDLSTEFGGSFEQNTSTTYFNSETTEFTVTRNIVVKEWTAVQVCEFISTLRRLHSISRK